MKIIPFEQAVDYAEEEQYQSTRVYMPTNTRKLKSYYNRNGVRIFWALRRLDRQSQERLKHNTKQILEKSDIERAVIIQNLSCSVITTSQSRKISKRFYEDSDGNPGYKNYSKKLRTAVNEQGEESKSQLFAQLGGAIIHRAKDRISGESYLVGLGLDYGSNTLLDENWQLLNKLVPNNLGFIEEHLNTPHVSIARVSSMAVAYELQNAVDQSDVPGSWITLSHLKAINS
jgi:hypothetical protein